MSPRGLQDWHTTLRRIYADRNFYRSEESIFVHLVEVVGGLSLIAGTKRKEGLLPEAFLAKSLGWWMSLCAKVGVADLESLVWTKFPNVCPYCEESPHKPAPCKKRRKSGLALPDWPSLINLAANSQPPETLDDWRLMFSDLYPRVDTTSQDDNLRRLLEELGELAETMRALAVSPRYFYSEAADVFAWLMGMANQYLFDTDQEDRTSFLQELMTKEYPGRCRVCNREVCKCAPILPETIGRLTREVPSNAYPQAKGTISAQEMERIFRLGDTEVRVRQETFLVGQEALAEIRLTSAAILLAIKNSDQRLHKDLEQVTATLENLMREEQLNPTELQSAVDEITRLSEDGTTVIQTTVHFLNSVAAGIWTQILLRAAS